MTPLNVFIDWKEVTLNCGVNLDRSIQVHDALVPLVQ